MNVLVTGAAGFIGSHLSERLVDLGHFVRGIDSLTDYYSRAMKERNAETLQAKGIPLLPLDLAVDDLNEALRGIDVVCHLAAQPGIAASTPFESYVRNKHPGNPSARANGQAVAFFAGIYQCSDVVHLRRRCLGR